MQHFFRLVLALAVATVLASGCSRTSSAVGVYKGIIGMNPPANGSELLSVAAFLLGSQMSGPCALTLNPGGTGSFKMSVPLEQPILWAEEEGKVIIRQRDKGKAPFSNSLQAPGDAALIATLSRDKQVMSLDLGSTQVELKKQTNAP